MSSLSLNTKTIWANLIEPIIIGIALILWICSMTLQFHRSLVGHIDKRIDELEQRIMDLVKNE